MYNEKIANEALKTSTFGKSFKMERTDKKI